MNIGKKDIIWNYAATFLKIASGILLLPAILKKMPSEEVGIWSVFVTITAFANLFDLGFNPSFARNVSYIFSGVRTLQAKGFESVDEVKEMDYGLLKGTITAMKWIYLRMSAVLFLLLSSIGTFYIFTLTKNYKGDHIEVYIAWAILCLISTYNLYTLYYDSLLQGKGLIKRSKQIIVAGQLGYIFVAYILITLGYGLISIVSAQAISVLITRLMSYYSFFDRRTKTHLTSALSRDQKEILSAITPNALKIGLTILGSFTIQKSAIIIGSLHLSLSEIGSYGITVQLVNLIGSLATIYALTFQPLIAQYRVAGNSIGIKQLYLKGQLVILITFIVCGAGMLLLGGWAMELIHSQTALLSVAAVSTLLFIAFLENNHAISGNILLSKNEVPFFKASLFSGALTLIILFALFQFTNLGVWTMILAPGIAQAIYQNWKWPYEVVKDLHITRNDLKFIFK